MDEDIEGDVGSLNVTALEEIREEFLACDGLISHADFDSLLDPTELQVHIDDGIGDAMWCRFDVQWYQTGCYSVHHTDENGLDFRFDHHPKPDAPDRHFHHPPDADSVTSSCIEVTEPRVVTRAVHQLWRRAYETGKLTALNTAENPP
ncbi:hypothetical protein EKH57_05320 [Halorubrum sp. BOL3-1]|uniref:hypothetical protein n=1 Tax=Halorubrum sp. BOL3-1 TaxID=2497325 RepID=UPI001005143A|nr:hypothetical protein [Halorubrum sp. BOL3-1]QAU12191.1 hypothetical protein EKH57_05320 [Halorubrum sp. BOL3-1]